MDVDMRPEVVSVLLSSVEAKWTQEAINVLSNTTDESVAYDAMEASCKKVSSAVVQGSDGDRLRVIEYMNSVCSEPNAKSNVKMCTAFGDSIQKFMIGDDVYNREQLDMSDFCHKFWTTHVREAATVQKKKLDEEEAKVLAEEKRREEEEIALRKKLAEEAAQKAAEEAKEKAALDALRSAAQAKLAEATAKNSSAIIVAPRLNNVTATKSKTNKTSPEFPSLSNAYAINNMPRALVIARTQKTDNSDWAWGETTQNKTETPTNTTSENSAQNMTQTSENATVQKSLVQNVTVQKLKLTPNDSESNQKNQSFAVDTIQNKTEVLANTTKLVLTNSSVVQKVTVSENTTMVTSNHPNKVIKHLRFILNRTRNVTASNSNNSLMA